jgi:hypothetical protein
MLFLFSSPVYYSNLDTTDNSELHAIISKNDYNILVTKKLLMIENQLSAKNENNQKPY